MKPSFQIAVTAVLLFFAGCVPTGRRVLTMEILQNDQLVLRTTFDGPDSEGPADFWRRAGLEPFAADEQVTVVKADEGKPLRATLTGPVRIRISHVDRLSTSAALTDLVLMREAPNSLRWHLAPEEVQRARRAAGF